MTEEDRAKIQQTMQDLAAQVLRVEQSMPGVQDVELVRWATSKLSGNAGAAPVPVPPPVPSPTPAPSPAPQAPQQVVAPQAVNEDEGVLHIQQTPGETIQPTGGSPNGTNNNYTQDNGVQ